MVQGSRWRGIGSVAARLEAGKLPRTDTVADGIKSMKGFQRDTSGEISGLEHGGL